MSKKTGLRDFTSRILLGIIILMVGLILVACEPQATEQPLEKVTIQLSWAHQGQFAGFYAAEELGYYAEEGLDVTMLPLAAPGDDTIATVMDGNADFGLSYGAGIVIGRSKASSVTAIATIHRRHPLAFMTLSDSGITKPQDFPGRSIRKLVPGSSAVAFQAVMTNLGLDPDSVKQVDVGFDLAPFLMGDLDIWPAFIINEVLTARESGYDTNLILPDDYGVHLYGITLFTTDMLVQDNPDLVLRFLRATLKGWRWAVENPEEAGRFAMKYDPTLDENLQAESMKAAVPLVHRG